MDRRLFLSQFEQDEGVIHELLDYTKNKFSADHSSTSRDDAPHIKTYQRYLKEAASEGSFKTLQKHLVQLQFPIQKGISQTDVYKSVTLRGQPKSGSYGLELEDPHVVRLEMYDSPLIGKVPVIIIPNYTDFQTILCALSYKNEPVKIPQSMGAAFLKGLNNWDRINTLKKEFLQNNPGGNWGVEFQHRVLPWRELYQDELIVLSTRPYSNVRGSELGFDEPTWESHSYQIRLTHECAHLFTLRHYGKMANNIHDEVIGDYAGITRILGRFDASWFLHFMGLENESYYRDGGRFENYTQGLSARAFEVLRRMVTQATYNISKFDTAQGKIANMEDYTKRVRSICECDLITMAMDNGAQHLHDKYDGLCMLMSNE